MIIVGRVCVIEIWGSVFMGVMMGDMVKSVNCCVFRSVEFVIKMMDGVWCVNFYSGENIVIVGVWLIVIFVILW